MNTSMTTPVLHQVYLLSKEEGGRGKPFTTGYQSQIFCKTWDAPAQMALKEGFIVVQTSVRVYERRWINR